MKGKNQQKHSYFWLVGAGGPGNYRRRTKSQEEVRRMLISAKFRAKGLGIPFDLSLGDIHVPKKCPILGRDFSRGRVKGAKNGGNPWSPTIDRIVPRKGYVKGNVCVISMKANAIKETSSLLELEHRLEKERAYLSDLRKVVSFYRKINT